MAKTTDNYPINFQILAEDFKEQQAGTKGWSQQDAEWLFESLSQMCIAYDDAQDELDKLNDVNQGDIYFPERATTTSGFDYNVIWTPFVTKDGQAGVRCQKLGTEDVTFFYFNPSTDGTGAPDVFLYEGEDGDPVNDLPVCFYVPDFKGEGLNT